MANERQISEEAWERAQNMTTAERVVEYARCVEAWDDLEGAELLEDMINQCWGLAMQNFEEGEGNGWHKSHEFECFVIAMVEHKYPGAKVVK